MMTKSFKPADSKTFLFTEVGQKIRGEYLATVDHVLEGLRETFARTPGPHFIDTQHKVHYILTADGLTAISGNTQLNFGLQFAARGDRVEIEYAGIMKLDRGRSVKKFEVSIDRGAEKT